MESQKDQIEVKPPPTTPTITSCRRKKNEDATFLEDLKGHIDEFINASMDEHKSCFTKTIQKMFGMSKQATKRTSSQQETETLSGAFSVKLRLSDSALPYSILPKVPRVLAGCVFRTIHYCLLNFHDFNFEPD